jgi:hypothetical protein
MVVVQLAHRAAHADRRDHFTSGRKHRRRDTTNADCVFFIIDRITTGDESRRALQTGAVASRSFVLRRPAPDAVPQSPALRLN